MSNLREAAQQALEALKFIHSEKTVMESRQISAAIDALRAALEHPVQRVNALARWAHQQEDPPDTEWQRGYEAARRWVRQVGLPALEQPEPEPVAWIQPDHLQKAQIAPFMCRVEPTQRCSDFVPLYTHPPREWKGLTDEIGRTR
jgi:hypothetical protein